MAALALVALGAGLLFRRPAAIPAALVLLGGGYGLLLAAEDVSLDRRAALIATALLLVSELAYWSLELRSGIVDEPGSYLRRVALLALLALGAAALAGGLLALVDVTGRGGLAVEIAGVGAALAVLLVLLGLARREA
jgi:hypothetical protein